MTGVGLLEGRMGGPQEQDLGALLTSGLGCLRQGISLVEVVHNPEARSCDGSTDCPPEFELGRVLYVNPALEEMTGLSAADLQAAGLLALFGPSSDPGDVAALENALHSRTGTTVRCTCYKRSAGPQGQPRTWSSSISITPINQLPFMSAAWLPSSSPSPARSCSYDASRELGPDLITGQEAGEKGPPRHSISGCSTTGSGGLTEGRQHSSSGSLHADGVAAQLLGHRGRTVVHYLCCHDDISSRIAEEMTWRLRDHALSSCSEGITIADPSQPDAPLIYVNDAFLQITGYSREDVIGRNCRFLQGEETSREAVATLKAAVMAKRKATVELLNYKKTGEAFWNRLSITPVFNDRGDLVSYIGVQSDVTELIRRKEEERRLMEAKVAAETATEAKSMFLANMSHEIRTPLNGMMATAQLLLASALTPEQRELAETILESGNSLLGILGDILDFSKLDHGSITLNYEPMCLRRSIEACIEIVAHDAIKKGLTLYYTADDEALSQPLMGDAIRMRQILTNLLSNAVKFTEKGEVQVSVIVEALPARQSCCCTRLPGETVVNHTCSPHHRPDEAALQAAAAAAVLAPPRPVQAPTQSLGAETCSAPPTPGTAGGPWRSADASWGASAPAETASTLQRRRSLEDPRLVPAAGGAASSGCAATAAKAAGSQRRVRISVHDTGIGIPSDVIGTLFQCFKQGSESMARRYGGTGLGLAICKRLSDLMQGSVWVESPGLDRGCTFNFCVPANFCAAAAQPQPPSQPQSQSAATESAASLQTGCTSEEAATPSRSSTELDSTQAAEDTDWSAVRQTPTAGYASSTASSGTGPSSTSGDGAPTITVSQGQFTVLPASEHQALEGRRVLIDISHPGLAQQVSQSCRQLGMQPCLCAPAADGSAATPLGQPQDLLIVSTDKASAALKSGWKGRPVVTIGDRNLLSANLYPLVVVVPEPVLHSRLANALVKSTVLLKWGSNGSKSAVPKLAHQPISPAQLADFKGWRDRGQAASITAALQQQQQQMQPLRGQYVGGQLAVLNSTQPALTQEGGLGFSGGFIRPYPYDPLGMTRRSSLDNSSLDRALVQQMLATQQARSSGAAPSQARTGTGDAAGSGGAGTSTEPAKSRPAPVTAVPWRPHATSGVQVPKSIPENTELQDEDASPLAASAAAASAQDTALTTPTPASAPAATAPAAAAAAGLKAAASKPASGGSNGASAAAPATPALRILIAEDNKVNQKVVLKVLQQISGAAVTDVVENGLQVLEALKQKSYDIILMDIHMPLMDGLEATRRIVATYPPANRPRIIALSADTLQALHDRCREAGIEEFIVKPFRVEDLKRVVQSYSRPQSCAPHAAPAGDTTTPPNTSNSLLGNRTVTAS